MVDDAKAPGLRLEVTRVQRASDWVGFVNVTTLACQKEHRHNLVTSFHIPLTPFPLPFIPNPGAITCHHKKTPA